MKPANATLPEEFISITSIRELSDGRLLVSDGRARRLVVGDFTTGRVEQIGRIGPGPQEYPSAGVLHTLGNDSSLMAIQSSRTWRLLHGTTIVASVRPDDPAIAATRGQGIAADSMNHLLVHIPDLRGKGLATVDLSNDSVSVLRISRLNGSTDTVARIKGKPRRLEVSKGAPGGTITRPIRYPFETGEIATMTLDGWIAVARLDPFRVDWRSPSGRWIHGAPLPVVLAKVTAFDRKVVTDSYPPRPDGRPLPIDLSKFPERMPPFDEGVAYRTLLGAPDGSVVIRRMVTPSSPRNSYDIVDRRGRLQAQLTLPANEQILGFGRQSVYVVVKDPDDLQRVRRHAWP